MNPLLIQLCFKQKALSFNYSSYMVAGYSKWVMCAPLRMPMFPTVTAAEVGQCHTKLCTSGVSTWHSDTTSMQYMVMLFQGFSDFFSYRLK